MILEDNTKRIKPEEKSVGQKLIMENRKCLTVSGVENVESFSETMVSLDTNFGRLLIKGENMHINKLSVDDGDFSLVGKINSLEYLKKQAKRGGFFENLFK